MFENFGKLVIIKNGEFPEGTVVGLNFDDGRGDKVLKVEVNRYRGKCFSFDISLDDLFDQFDGRISDAESVERIFSDWIEDIVKDVLDDIKQKMFIYDSALDFFKYYINGECIEMKKNVFYI